MRQAEHMVLHMSHSVQLTRYLRFMTLRPRYLATVSKSTPCSDIVYAASLRALMRPLLSPSSIPIITSFICMLFSFDIIVGLQIHDDILSGTFQPENQKQQKKPGIHRT